MLPKSNRLKKKKDFERVFRAGKGYKENLLYLKVAGSRLEASRFGFSISKKFSKKAVLRNRIRRQLREIIRAQLPSVKKGVDGTIVVMPGLAVKNFCELENIIKKLFSKAGILKEVGGQNG